MDILLNVHTVTVCLRSKKYIQRGNFKFFWMKASLEASCATLWWKWLVFSFFLLMEHRWNEIDRGKPKYSGKNLSQYHFVHHKSYMDWPGIEPGPPRWEAGHCLSHGTALNFKFQKYLHWPSTVAYWIDADRECLILAHLVSRKYH
jgi:hypothetical protein